MFIISDLRESRESTLQLVWVSVLFIWNVVVTLALFVLVFGWWSVSPELFDAVHDVEHRSVLAVATQLGRLDVLTLLLAIFALGGFWMYGNVVDRAARSELKRIAPELIGVVLKDHPEVITKAVNKNVSALALLTGDGGEDFSSEIAASIADVEGSDKDMDDGKKHK